MAVVNKRKHQANLAVQAVQQYVVQQGNKKVGLSLGPKGPAPAKLSPNTFNLLNESIVSQTRLNQINQDGSRNKRINLLESVQKVLNPLHISGAQRINQLLKISSIQFKIEVGVSMGDRREVDGLLTRTCQLGSIIGNAHFFKWVLVNKWMTNLLSQCHQIEEGVGCKEPPNMIVAVLWDGKERDCKYESW